MKVGFLVTWVLAGGVVFAQTSLQTLRDGTLAPTTPEAIKVPDGKVIETKGTGKIRATSAGRTITQTAHGLSEGSVIYNSNGTWARAQANSITTARATGWVVDVIDENSFTVVFSGEVPVTGLAANTQYYLSASTAGGLVITPPSSVGTYVVPVLRTGPEGTAYIAIGEPLSNAKLSLVNDVTGILPAANGGAGTVSGIMRADGAGQVSAAVAGTHYALPPGGTGLQRADGAGGFTEVSLGTNLSFTGNTLNAAGGGETADESGTIKLWSRADIANRPSGWLICDGTNGTLNLADVTGGAAYIVKGYGTVDTPTFDPAAGTYLTTQSVAIATTTANATIRYTTNGDTPTRSSGTVYSSAVSVASSQTLKAIAYNDLWVDSAVATAAYTIEQYPTLSSATIGTNGTTWTLAFSEAVSVGAGGSGGFVPTLSAGSTTLTYASGTGTSSLVYTGGTVVNQGVTGTLAYTQPGNGIEDSGGNDLASFSGTEVVNNSTQTGSVTYDLEENMEGTGLPSGWTNGGNVPNWDYTTVALQGTQSALFSFASAYTTISSGTTYEAFALIRFTGLPASTGSVFGLRNSDGSAALAVMAIDASGNVYLRNTAAGLSTACATTMTTGVKYYVWIHYTQSGTCTLAFSTDGTRPTSGSQYTTLNVGTGTVARFDFSNGASYIADRALALKTGTISDNP